jgi:hypothetical protein
VTQITTEAGKSVRSFMTIMKEQPLSLALVVMNFVLLGYLFYNGTQLLKLRNDTTALIVAWQQESDKLMANCVSEEIMKLVLDAIKREAPQKQKSIWDDVPLPGRQASTRER